MTETRTYDSFIVKQIMPAAGWQALYYLEDDQAHLVCPVHALALAFRVTRECYPSRRIVPQGPSPQEEQWEIVGLFYSPDSAWDVCDSLGNYCGLLPPDMTLATFMETSMCRHIHPQAAESLAVVEQGI